MSVIVVGGEFPSEVYPRLVDEILCNGEVTTPRGKKCHKAKAPVCVQYRRADAPFISAPGKRGFNLALSLAEVIGILGAYPNVAFHGLFSKNITQFSDDGVVFNGHYGVRIEKLCDRSLNLLKTDHDTRQACIPIFHPIDAVHGYNSKDIPCNTQLILKRRGDALDMNIIRRSNDVYWGYPYNLSQFMHLQAAFAGLLGIRQGNFYEFIMDLHAYDQDYYKIEDVFAMRNDKFQDHNWDPYTVVDLSVAPGYIPPLKHVTREVSWNHVVSVFRPICKTIEQRQMTKVASKCGTLLGFLDNLPQLPEVDSACYWRWVVAIVAVMSFKGDTEYALNLASEFKDQIGVPMPSCLSRMLKETVAPYPKTYPWQEEPQWVRFLEA